MNQMDKFSIKIDVHNDKPHNGKLITKIEASPKEKYFVTYSKEDNSIVGWDIEDKDGSPLKLDKVVDLSDIKEETLYQLCVSDDKKLVCRYGTHKYHLG